MSRQANAEQVTMKKAPFLAGVFLVTFSVLVFQIVQTRILSVIAWYYLAFFAISVAMLGMTVGAVWVYLRRERFRPEQLGAALSDYALLCAISMPASLMLQFCLITTLALSATTVIAWSLLLLSMAVPYVFAGVVVSLALTRSPFPLGQVYGVDLLGAALGCAAVLALLNLMDAPSAIIMAGFVAGLAALFFARAAGADEQARLRQRPWWRRPQPWVVILLLFTAGNAMVPVGIKPILVKDQMERNPLNRYEKWNSYSRIVASQPKVYQPYLWGPSPKLDPQILAPTVELTIDGAAGTAMQHYDGTDKSIDFLHYDLVNLAYNLPGLNKAAIIGVGGGRDLMSAHLYGVKDITGVELNPIFINLHTKNPFYKNFSNLTKIPNLHLHVDDARSWFASSTQEFDLIQMSMIDTWAATGAGAFSLSENGLYTLEGWRAFLKRLTPDGIFTVSRWYNPNDLNETGRMISLATAALLDEGVTDAKSHLFVASAKHIATLVLSKSAFTPEQLKILHGEVDRLEFKVLLAPDQPADSELLNQIVASTSIAGINQLSEQSFLDTSVPTDNRPFFFNQLRFSRILEAVRKFKNGELSNGVLQGNLIASAVLLLILVISLVAVATTIVWPLRHTAKTQSRRLIAIGTAYFSLIGMGFMLAEIALLQSFSVYLGHPIYALGVCLFSLILATGLGSLASNRIRITSPGAMLLWGLLVGGYLIGLQTGLSDLFASTTSDPRSTRILISLAAIMPLGFLMGFAFPTGMTLVEAIDREPTPWFWGINGATGVLASVIGVMLSMSEGIHVTMVVSGLCYLALIPVGITLIKAGRGR